MVKKNNPKISVVVPAYNVEKYIEKCLDSLVNQTYTNIEIIVVDDCSKDETTKVIKKYIKDKKNIIYIKNEKNSGLSFTRNHGIEKATGEYIGFIDSDDFVPYDYYEKLYETIKDENSDIAVCDINIVFEDSQKESISTCGRNSDSKEAFINCGLAASACNKLFKKELFNDIRFEVGKINEDVAVIIPLLAKYKISYAGDTHYNYIQRGTSIQNSHITEKRFDIFNAINLTIERLKDLDNNDDIKEMIIYQQLVLFLFYVLVKESNFFKRIKWLRKYRKLIKKYNIYENKYVKEFIQVQGKKHQIYYKSLLKTLKLGLCFTSSMIIGLYNILKKVLIKSVIKKDISLEDVVKQAKHQSKLKSNKHTVSVTVPNYNYARFMYQRIYSILCQKVKIDELIILDDCSTDNSREVIDEIVENIKDYVNVKKVYNDKNGGSAFKSWRKGFELATSEYVWIAEADDYSNKNFLREVVKPINDNENKKIILSYTDTSFMDKDGNVFLATIKNEIDLLKTGHWDNKYLNDGKEEFKNYSYLNTTIANVSSTIIKKENYTEVFEEAGAYKQAGDFLFYSTIMHEGYVAYSNKKYNYYRVHGSNVTSVTKKESHLEELKRVHNYFDEKYKLNKEQKKNIKERYEFLEDVWGLKRK